MKWTKAIVVAASASLCLCNCSSSSKTTAPAIVDDSRSVRRIEKEVVRLVNEYRQSKGLKPLKVADEITVEAEKHSENMGRKKVAFGHGGFDARYSRIRKALPGIGGGAENVAYGNISVADIVKGWINSPGHRKNMEGLFNVTGVGVYRDNKGVLFYTQLFFNQIRP